MNGYRIRPRAEQDPSEHFAYIAQDRTAPAERFLKVAEQSIEQLAAFPHIGHPWKSRYAKLRDIFFHPLPAPYRNHLIFYNVASDQPIETLAVPHAETLAHY
jgi:plasmid stabilization system protein ParE